MMVMLDRVAQRYSINPLDLIERDPYAIRMVQMLSAAGLLTDSTEREREQDEPENPLAGFQETI